MKKIAALTMVRNDDFYLRKWVEYYGAQLGRENLYIWFDGTDQVIAPFCEGTHAQLHEKIGMQVVSAEKGRLKFLSDQAAALLAGGYDLVIGVDADEFVVVDPKRGISLREYLSEQRIGVSLSALGLDFGQKLGEEPDITEDRPFLQQRHYAQIGTRYTKPSIVAKPCVWGSGFHRIKGHNFHIGKDLYLLHFGYFDMKRLQDRFQDADRLSQGWGAHMQKRARTIRYATELPARDFDRWTRFGRICQTLCRPPYALNKPAMFELRIVVRIPERFRARYTETGLQLLPYRDGVEGFFIPAASARQGWQGNVEGTGFPTDLALEFQTRSRHAQYVFRRVVRVAPQGDAGFLREETHVVGEFRPGTGVDQLGWPELLLPQDLGCVRQVAQADARLFQ